MRACSGWSTASRARQRVIIFNALRRLSEENICFAIERGDFGLTEALSISDFWFIEPFTCRRTGGARSSSPRCWTATPRACFPR